jgi:protein gp37
MYNSFYEVAMYSGVGLLMEDVEFHTKWETIRTIAINTINNAYTTDASWDVTSKTITVMQDTGDEKRQFVIRGIDRNSAHEIFSNVKIK